MAGSVWKLSEEERATLDRLCRQRQVSPQLVEQLVEIELSYLGRRSRSGVKESLRAAIDESVASEPAIRGRAR